MTQKHYTRLAGGAAIWLVLAGSAVAEVTAAEVWESWKSYAESIGQQISIGSQSTSGDTLTLNDVTMSMEIPDGGKASGTLQMLEFQGRPDGTVVVTMSPDYPLSLSMKAEGGAALDMGLIVRQTDLSMVASGGDGSIAYDYDAPAISVDVDRMFVDGQDFAPVISFAMSNIDGTYTMDEGDLRRIKSAFTADAMDVNVSFTDPRNDGTMNVTARINTVVSDSAATLPNEIDMQDPGWVFGGDFGAEGTLSSGASTYSTTMNNGVDTFKSDGTSANSALHFSIRDGVVAYGGTATDTQYRVSGSQIPFPEVSLGMQETAFDLKMPLQQTDAPTDFGLLTRVVGLTVGDEIWSMIDPGAVLPRDPATAIIDVSGTLKWLMDISDPEAMAAAGDAMPAELHTLNINDITLSVAGASVEGEGGFTFDQTDTTTFNGMPAPTGEVNFTIVGANVLIEKLIQLGFLPQDQAMGAQMMLGMFTRPGENADTLTTKIEVKGNGSVFANGQQVK